MAFDWTKYYGIGQSGYDAEQKRINDAIAGYKQAGNQDAITKAEKHRGMFEQAYKGIDPNTGKAFGSNQPQPTVSPSAQNQPRMNPFSDMLMGSFSAPDFSSADRAARQTADYQYGRVQNQVDTASQRLLDSYNSGLRRSEDDFKFAEGRLDKSSHLDRLRAKESLVASGNADSSAGLADMDTRLTLAKQENLTDLTRGYQRQNEDLTDYYNSGQQALNDQLAQFDYTKIYNDAFAPLQQAIMEAQQNKQKTALDLYNNAENRMWDEYKFNNLSADQSAQMQQKMMDIMSPYLLGMTPKEAAQYGPGGTEWAKIESDLLRHYDPSGDALTRAQSALDVANVNGQFGLEGRRISGEYDLEGRRITGEYGLAREELAGIARLAAQKAAKGQGDISEEDVLIFTENLVPGEDTRESAKAGILALYQNKQITAQQYRAFEQANNAYWDQVDKAEAERAANSPWNFKNLWDAFKSELSGSRAGWNNQGN